MDQLKEAFQKVKEDISNLSSEFQIIKNYLNETRSGLVSICEVIKELSNQVSELKLQDRKVLSEKAANLPQQLPLPPMIPYYFPFPVPTNQQIIPTNQQVTPALSQIQSGDNLPYRIQKEEKIEFSTGNGGVPTDKQTNRQTDQHMPLEEESSYNQNILPKASTNKERDSMYSALSMLNSLDSFKKEIRLKFKRLTDQEMTVFSTIYQLEEETGFTDYTTLSNKLSLSESSIRDYVGKLIKKGVPLEKTKINNKSVQISVSDQLKKIVSLPTIIQLREL